MPEGRSRRDRGAKGRRAAAAAPRRRPLRFPIDPEFVARAVDEGVLMSRTALTMATMNHIVVGALRQDALFDPTEISAFLERELRALTLEQTAMAAHMRRLMVEFPPSFKRSTTISDHHLLVQRRVIYSALASELERLRGDGSFVAEAVDASARWAWSEISRAIEARLDTVAHAASGTGGDIDFRADPSYPAERAERMRLLREVDLAALVGGARAESKGLPGNGHPVEA